MKPNRKTPLCKHYARSSHFVKYRSQCWLEENPQTLTTLLSTIRLWWVLCQRNNSLPHPNICYSRWCPNTPRSKHNPGQNTILDQMTRLSYPIISWSLAHMLRIFAHSQTNTPQIVLTMVVTTIQRPSTSHNSRQSANKSKLGTNRAHANPHFAAFGFRLIYRVCCIFRRPQISMFDPSETLKACYQTVDHSTLSTRTWRRFNLKQMAQKRVLILALIEYWQSPNVTCSIKFKFIRNFNWHTLQIICCISVSFCESLKSMWNVNLLNMFWHLPPAQFESHKQQMC